MTKKEQIDLLIKDKKYLISSRVYNRNVNQVKNILELPYWKENKFQKLLTSEILQNKEYQYLLTPSIFNVSLTNLYNMIDLFKEYSIDKYITNRCVRRNVNLQRKLIEFMIENNVNLIIDNKLNPILNASNKALKENYNIDIKKINILQYRKVLYN